MACKTCGESDPQLFYRGNLSTCKKCHYARSKRREEGIRNGTIASRGSYLGKAKRSAMGVSLKKRTCLKCDRRFDSLGPGNRICPNCALGIRQHNGDYIQANGTVHRVYLRRFHDGSHAGL